MRLNFKMLGLLGAHVARGIAKLAGLTPSRLDFVTALVHGPLCQRDIAAKLCVHESVVSRMVRALMKKGLVGREIPRADRRYRVVYLTVLGWDEYMSMTECEWFLRDDARYGVQAVGESLWRGHWDAPLEKMGLGALTVMERDDFTDAVPVVPPYAGIRRHLRKKLYRDPFDSRTADVEAEWAWNVSDPQPPMAQGIDADPLTTACAAQWRPRPDDHRWGAGDEALRALRSHHRQAADRTAASPA